MKLLSFFRSFCSAIFRRARVEREMDEELRAHIQNRAEDLVRSGVSRPEAERRARMEFGGYQKYKEEIRESLGAHFIESLLQDIRYALRMLRKSPGFTVVAVLTLALGIGANTAIFSAVYGLLLRPLPYADISRLVTVEGTEFWPKTQVGAVVSFSGDGWKQIEAHAPEFEQCALYSQGQFTLTGGFEPQKLSAAEVSGNCFSLLGVHPILGRPILQSDTQPVNARVAVLSFDLWRGSFAGDSTIIGREITLNGTPYKVIGVMPPEVDFGAGQQGLWLSGSARTQGGFVIARLKSGFTIKQANAQLKVATVWFAKKYPMLMHELSGWQIHAYPVTRDIGQLGDGLLILFGAVGFVLLLACVNVSSLLLARNKVRRKEIAIRAALGATRGRIIKQFLAESLLLAFAGGLIGLLFAEWGIRTLRLIAPPGTPHLELLRLDPGVLGFTACVSILAGVLFGLAPALQASKHRTGAGLKQVLGGSSGSFSARPAHRLVSLLVIVEVALSVILVTGAVLAGRSLEKMASVKLGFRTDHILTLSADFSQAVCNPWDQTKLASCQLAVANVLRRLRALPGVRAAAATSYAPLKGFNGAMSLQIEGRPGEFGMSHGSMLLGRPISPGYFRTMGIPVLAGRSFNSADAQKGERVVVVNELLAHNYFSGNALGHRISIDKDKEGRPEWMEIVGVVGDTRDFMLTEKPDAEYYIPFAQTNYFPGGTFVLRTTENPLAIVAGVKKQIWSVDNSAPITDVQTMDRVVFEQMAEPRFRGSLLGAFGALGLMLAMIGIYGVISYGVAQRTHEIGVRLALGAQPRDLLLMVIREGILLACVGIIAGIGGGLALTRFLRSLLFEIKPTDPETFLAVAILLLVVALLASYIPARRATKVDPMVALRYE
jgi:predicted permease